MCGCVVGVVGMAVVFAVFFGCFLLLVATSLLWSISLFIVVSTFLAVSVGLWPFLSLEVLFALTPS